MRIINASAAQPKALARVALLTPIALVMLTSAAGAQESSDATQIEQGRYVAIAADCSACHTAPGSAKEMAGGYAIASPVGAIWSSNITPSKTNGIGGWSEKEFARAVREGVSKDGHHLYPAMPYSSYARITDADMHALYLYFMKGVAPVDEPAPVTTLAFPFNIRASMAGWNMLFSPDPMPATISSLNEQEKRGEYLSNALAHCSTCHTPRNAAMALVSGASLAGGQLGSWFAPNITSDATAGIGSWSDDELAQYLKTGRAEGRGQAAGPMAEAVQHSFQHLSDEDVSAIVAYLRKVRPVNNASLDRSTVGKAISDEDVVRGLPVASGKQLPAKDQGATIYSGNCASCHGNDGQGGYAQEYPSLTHNSAVGAANPSNLVSVIMQGVERSVGGKKVQMPAFGPTAYVNQLSNEEIALLANYVTKTFGQGDAGLTAEDIKLIADGGPKPVIVKFGAIMPFLGGLVILLVLVVLVTWRIRRNSKKGA